MARTKVRASQFMEATFDEKKFSSEIQDVIVNKTTSLSNMYIASEEQESSCLDIETQS